VTSPSSGAPFLRRETNVQLQVINIFNRVVCVPRLMRDDSLTTPMPQTRRQSWIRRLCGGVQALMRRRRNEHLMIPITTLCWKQFGQLTFEVVVNGVWLSSQCVECFAGKATHRCRQRNIQDIDVFKTQRT
jgi:hypothetical protein